MTVYSCAAVYATEPETHDSRASAQTLPGKNVGSWTPGMTQKVCGAWRSEFDSPNHTVGRENQLPQTVFRPLHVCWSSIYNVHMPTNTCTTNTYKKQFKVCAPVPKVVTMSSAAYRKSLTIPLCLEGPCILLHGNQTEGEKQTWRDRYRERERDRHRYTKAEKGIWARRVGTRQAFVPLKLFQCIYSALLEQCFV